MTELDKKIEDAIWVARELFERGKATGGQKGDQTGREVILAGDGVPVYLELIKKNLKVPYLLAPAHLNRQRAGAVAVLGIQYAKEGKLESAMEHQPDYLRLSQAERERAQKQAQKEDV